jgi:hypothetical protein
MESRSAAAQVLDERGDPALIAEVVAFTRSLVSDRDSQTCVQEGELAETLGENVEGEFRRGKYLWVWVEGHACPGLVGDADCLEGTLGDAALIGLAPDFSGAFDLQLEAFGKCVYDRNSDTVEAAGNFIGGIVELSTGVKSRQNHLGCGAFLDEMKIDWNATSIIDDGDTRILVNDNRNFGTKAADRFVDRVVYDLIDEMVQTLGTSGPDVHCRAFSNWIEAFENLD